MASLSHSISLSRRVAGGAGQSLPVELAVAFLRPRLEASLRRLELRDDIPAAFRRPNLRGKYRPALALATLRRSWALYRETVAALSSRGDHALADIAIHREDIHDIAMAASFGWLLAIPLQDSGGPLARLKSRVHDLRVELLPTQDELDELYLAGSADLNELEYRMRTLDQRRAGAQAPAAAMWGPNR